MTVQQTTKRTLDAVRPPPQLPAPLPSRGRQRTAVSNPATETRGQQRLYPTVPADDLPSTSRRDDSHHERVLCQKEPAFSKLREPIPLARDTSGSSKQYSSKSDFNEEESALPVYSFMEYQNSPAVVYTKSENEANSLVRSLKGPLGFDLEWRVMWHPGAQERRTALVQLCDHHTILLIKSAIIESADVVKTGANILNDGEKLYRDFGIRAKGLVELGAIATQADTNFCSVYNRDVVSLAKMVAMYLGRTLLKGKVRTSNWEADLSRKMVEYAANDCHCALMVYDRLQQIASRDGRELDPSTYSRQVIPIKSKPVSRAVLGKNFHPQTVAASSVPHYCIPEPPRPQQFRAYKLWHVDRMPLARMCMELRIGGRVEPLKESTVISYVVGALHADPRLPFNMNDLKTLVLMEASSWQRHRQWIASRE
ncbi:ribonuclease H-like protein [Chiua virens]|nr:ribonuclease H-like protein [Chiua virens]